MSVTDASDEEIAEALMKLVENEVELGTFVVLEGDIERNYYVQFALDGGRLYCEAVSNQYLEPPNELSDAQLRTLENLGWREPEHHGQNWFRTFRPTSAADYAEIVAMARRAFVEVYGLAPDVPLEMKCSWDDEDERLGSDGAEAGSEDDPITVEER